MAYPGSTSITSQSGIFVGGVAGANVGTVSYCDAISCNVGRTRSQSSFSTGSNSALNFWGGLVGINAGTLNNSMANDCLTASHGMSSTPTTLARVGGLVGQNSGTVTNCYNLKCGVGGYQQLGGICGWNGGTISYTAFCDYTYGVYNGSTTNVSRCVGYNSGTLTNLAYVSSSATTSGTVYGKTDANCKGTGLQSILGTTHWTYTSGQYPTLDSYNPSGR